MDRDFVDIPQASLSQRSDDAWLGFRSGRPLHWNEILGSPRVLIYAEAGSGKTFECEQRQRLMWEAGEPAFFLELDALAQDGVMLSPPERQRLVEWKRGNARMATFFLDAYDELKLNRHSFRSALLRLANELEGQLTRVRLVITSRPIEFERELLLQLFPVDSGAPQTPSELFVSSALSEAQAKKEEGQPPWRHVLLQPLSDAQILELAASKGVANVVAFEEDIRRRNAWAFARRPQDLIEMCAGWTDTVKSRSHREDVEANIEKKLAAKPRDDALAALSVQRAREGAEQLALAALLCGGFNIRYRPADDPADLESAIDPGVILSHWSPSEQVALLQRGLFKPATYGRVSFHNRSVLEYLAASRLVRLLGQGFSVRAIKRLVFATSALQHEVVKPSMRAAAAWLALDVSSIFDELLSREPQTLLNEGDPSAMQPRQRVAAFRAYVERFGKRGWTGQRVPLLQVHRLAAPELGEEIVKLWPAISNPEVREMALALVEYGRYPQCADIALESALNAQASDYERINALEALLALGDPRVETVCAAVIAGPEKIPVALARALATRLFPSRMGASQFLKLLERTEPTSSANMHRYWVSDILEAADGSTEMFEALRQALTDWIEVAPPAEEHWGEIAAARPWLRNALAATCIQLVRRRQVSSAVMQSSSIVVRLVDIDYEDRLVKQLKEDLSALAAATQLRAFYVDFAWVHAGVGVEGVRQAALESMHNGPVSLSLEALQLGGSRVSDKTLPPIERALALELARAGLEDGSPEAKAALRQLVADAPSLLKRLDQWLAPATEDPEWERRRQRGELQRSQRALERQTARASWEALWEQVVRNPEAMFAEDKGDSTTWNIWQAMTRRQPSHNDGGWRREFLESTLGKDTADRMRRALMRIWRGQVPSLPSERPENERDTFLTSWLLGLAGITAESEDPQWASELTDEEAALTLRFARLTSSVPTWLRQVSQRFPQLVTDVLGGELAWELEQPLSDRWHSTTLQELARAPAEVVACFVPVLRRWLDAEESAVPVAASHPMALNRLGRVLNVLVLHDDENLRDHLRALASKHLESHSGAERTRVWIGALLHFDVPLGVEYLEQRMRILPIAQHGEAVRWLGDLFTEGWGRVSLRLGVQELTPDLLLRLNMIMFGHVRPSDDVHHEGAYSPDERDNAERGRGALFNALLSARGPRAWDAKMQLAADPMFTDLRDRIQALALEADAQSVDSEPMQQSEVAKMTRDRELRPASNADMFALLMDRLDDLEDMLLGPTSPREGWAKHDEERILRRLIAHELEHSSRGAYTVDQEGVTADEKEHDIALKADRVEAVIELKVGERWSGAVLRDRIYQQLVNQYMAPSSCKAGCMLVTVANEGHRWRHPDTDALLDAEGLSELLAQEADRLRRVLGDIWLSARILDLRPRLRAQRGSSSLKLSSGREMGPGKSAS